MFLARKIAQDAVALASDVQWDLISHDGCDSRCHVETAAWSLLAKFDGEFASGSRTYAGTGSLRYSW